MPYLKPFQFNFRVLCESFQLKGEEKKKNTKQNKTLKPFKLYGFFFPIIVFKIYLFNIYTSPTFLSHLSFHLPIISIFLPPLPFHLPTTIYINIILPLSLHLPLFLFFLIYTLLL